MVNQTSFPFSSFPENNKLDHLTFIFLLRPTGFQIPKISNNLDTLKLWLTFIFLICPTGFQILKNSSNLDTLTLQYRIYFLEYKNVKIYKFYNMTDKFCVINNNVTDEHYFQAPTLSSSAFSTTSLSPSLVITGSQLQREHTTCSIFQMPTRTFTQSSTFTKFFHSK